MNGKTRKNTAGQTHESRQGQRNGVHGRGRVSGNPASAPNGVLDQRQAEARALGRRLRDARKQRGLNQADVAYRLRIHVRSIQRWEAGDIQPSLEYLVDLAKLYGVPVGDLL